MLQKWSKTHIFKNTPTGTFEIEPARNQFKLVQHSQGFFRIIFWTSWKEMARKIISTNKYHKYKLVELILESTLTRESFLPIYIAHWSNIWHSFQVRQWYGYFWEINSIMKSDIFCKIKDRHCTRSQWKGERSAAVRRRPWSVWGWERGKSKVFRCLTDGGVSQPNVKIGWKLQRKVEGKIYALAYEQLKWYGKLCNPPPFSKILSLIRLLVF